VGPVKLCFSLHLLLLSCSFLPSGFDLLEMPQRPVTQLGISEEKIQIGDGKPN
jgi:hypothetical protein